MVRTKENSVVIFFHQDIIMLFFDVSDHQSGIHGVTLITFIWEQLLDSKKVYGEMKTAQHCM